MKNTMPIIVALTVAFAAVTSALADYSRMDFLTCRTDGTSGTWCLTDYTPISTDRIEMKIRSLDFSNNHQCLFCSRNTDQGGSITAFIISGTRIRFDRHYGMIYSGKTLSAETDSTVDHVFTYDGNAAKGYVDDANAVSLTAASAFTGASKMALFAGHVAGASISSNSEMYYFGRYRFYYCRVHDKDGKLIHNYVPARDNSAQDGAPAQYGVYDSVTEQFFANLGSFTFDTTGAQVLGPLGKAASPEREVVIREYSASEVQGSDYEVAIDISNPGFAQRIFLGWSPTTAAGDTTNTWEHVEQLSDVQADEVTRIVPLPAGARYIRFFLQPLLPDGARAVRYLQSSGANEYIDTEFTPNSNSRADYHITMLNPVNVFMAPFGSRSGNSYQFWIGAATGTGTSSNYWFLRSSNLGQVQVFDPNWPGEHFISIDHNQYKIDDYVKLMSRTTFTCAGPAHIFAVNNGGATLFANMQLHSCSIWDDGTLVRDYVPCVKADGNSTPALYDAVTGGFSVNRGTTPLICGEEVWAISAVMEIGNYLPVRAEWSGSGEAGNLSDSRNWTCWNVNGTKLENVIPNEDTVVEVKGITTFSCPTGSDFAYKSIAFDCVLAGNADWRGLDPSRVVADPQIELNGHSLQITALEGAGTIQNSAVGMAELHIDVVEGKTVENSQFVFGGKLKLVKDGVGNLVMSKPNQTYTGGTLVAEGCLTMGENGGLKPIGEGSMVTVTGGATLDMNGYGSFSAYDFVLAGGTLANTVAIRSSFGLTGTAQIKGLTLTEDSFANITADYGVLNSGFAAAVIDLGGHALTVKIGNGKKILLANTTVKDGTLVVEGGCFYPYEGSHDVTFANATLVSRSAFYVQSKTLALDNYTADYGENAGAAGTIPTVKGVFTPLQDYFAGCKLLNGATLCLTNQMSAWTPYSKITSGVSRTVTFADNATIKIDLRGRELAVGEQLVAWQTIPENLNTLTFVQTQESAQELPEALFVTHKGVFYGADPASTVIETATWTGRAGDCNPSNPENWDCKNMAGGTVPGVLPTGDSVNMFGNWTLTKNCDCRFLTSFSGTIDLNGYTLQVSTLEGSGLIMNSSSNAAELHVDVAEGKTVVNTQFILSGNLRLVKDGAGTFVPARYNQTYTGGNVVKNGVLKLNSSSEIVGMATEGYEKPLGETQALPIVVMTNAVYDISGLYDSYLVPVELVGGTLRNSKSMSDLSKGAIDNVTVTAEGSLFDFQVDTVIHGSNIDLGGHVLEINGAPGLHRYMNGGMTNGTLNVTSSGWFMFNGAFFAPTVDLIANAAFYLSADVTVRNLTVLYDLNFAEGSHTVNILGVFTPSEHNYLNHFVLQNGATINLANWDGVYDIETSLTGQTLGFADDEPTVYVSLGNRKVPSKEKVVAWSVDKAPNVKFKPAPGSDFVLAKGADGLYVERGLTLIFR